MRFVGIDVGHKELTVVIIANGKTTKARTFSNTPEGHVQLIRFLPQEGKIAVEKWLISIRGRTEGWLSWQKSLCSKKIKIE